MKWDKRKRHYLKRHRRRQLEARLRTEARVRKFRRRLNERSKDSR